jgi:hypothetical protein
MNQVLGRLKTRDALPYLLLVLIGLFSLGMKLSTIQVGAPYVTIDDQTMYEGGFLVWFGQAPLQRMYLESWISGVTPIATYVAMHAGEGDLGGVNLIAEAYRDFKVNPDPYVTSYRSVMLLVDLATAILVFLLGREIFRNSACRDWIAALAAIFYLLSFNTLWSFVVARPDTLTAFLAVAGLYLYYRSDFGNRRGALLGSGAVMGPATGMKLHGAFFVIFICLDMWRVWGFIEAFRRVFAFVCLSLLGFVIAAGSLLFDPTLYVKLRLLNARDDASPWLEWGDQFITMLRGTGWLIIPVLLGTVWYARTRGFWRQNQRLASVIFIALCWLVLFSLLRVLRAYWMLPALPLFYLVAAYGVVNIQWKPVKLSISALIVLVLAVQLIQEARSFRAVPFDELRTWFRTNVQTQEPVYVLGHNAVNLPLNTTAIRNHQRLIERGQDAAIAAGEPFTQRHIRLWEERATLRKFDMLDSKSEVGFNYYGYFGTPPEAFKAIYPLEEVRYILKQEHFDLTDEVALAEVLAADYEPIATLIDPGGGGNGLSYTVYRRD